MHGGLAQIYPPKLKLKTCGILDLIRKLFGYLNKFMCVFKFFILFSCLNFNGENRNISNAMDGFYYIDTCRNGYIYPFIRCAYDSEMYQ